MNIGKKILVNEGMNLSLREEQSLMKRKIKLWKKLVEELSKERIEQPPNLRSIDRRRLKCASEKVDRVLQHVTLRIETLKQLNNILKTVGKVAAGLAGEKRKEQIKRANHGGKDAFKGK